MSHKQRLIEREKAKPGFKGKVNAKCIECIYDDIGGNGAWRQQVEACAAISCPLYEIRPKSKSEADSD